MSLPRAPMESLASLCISQLLGLPGARVPHPHPIMPSHPSDHAPLKPTGEDSLGRQAMGGQGCRYGFSLYPQCYTWASNQELTRPTLFPLSSRGGARVGGTNPESEEVQELGTWVSHQGLQGHHQPVSTASSLSLCWRQRSVEACREESHHPDGQELAGMAKSNSLWPAGFHQHVHLHTVHMPTGRLSSQHPPLGSGDLTCSHLGQVACP